VAQEKTDRLGQRDHPDLTDRLAMLAELINQAKRGHRAQMVHLEQMESLENQVHPVHPERRVRVQSIAHSTAASSSKEDQRERAEHEQPNFASIDCMCLCSAARVSYTLSSAPLYIYTNRLLTHGQCNILRPSHYILLSIATCVSYGSVRGLSSKKLTTFVVAFSHLASVLGSVLTGFSLLCSVSVLAQYSSVRLLIDVLVEKAVLN